MTDQAHIIDQAASDNTARTFTVLHIALKYARLEVSLSSYQLLKGQEKPEWSPKIDTEIQAKATPFKDEQHEVLLTLLLTGKTQQGQSIFQIKLEQGGIFEAKNFTKEEENILLRGHALGQLYPYACNRVNELLVQAGFPPIHLNPIDFVGLYQRQQAQQEQTVQGNEVLQ